MHPLSTRIRVLTLADSRYAMPLAVMVRSLLENRPLPLRPIEITIIDGGLTAEDRGRLIDSWRGIDQDASFRFVPHSSDATLPVWGRVPAITYARLLLEDYYPGQSGRIILLDSDTLILNGIEPLHDVDLEGAAAGACQDPFIPTVSALDGLAGWREAGLTADAPYFNAGIMTIDLDRWRELDVTAKALDYIRREHLRLRQYDQDGLNAVLASSWKALDPCWHCHPRAEHSLGTPWPSDPRIVHFSGRLKPWLYPATHPADQSFFEYLDRTSWHGFRPPSYDLTALFYRLYDSPARRLLHPFEARFTAWQREREISTTSVTDM